MPELGELQYDMHGLLLGAGTAYQIREVDFGTPDMRPQDVDRAREDGIRFGRDYRRARTITFEGAVLTTGPALDAIDALTAAWLADDIRLQPGVVTTLRMRRGGRARRVWGRPRNIAVTSGATLRGWAPFTAEFTTADHLFYDDVEQTASVDIVPPIGGGVVSPVVSPVTTVAESVAQGRIVVGGTAPTWPVIRINGPIMRPTVELLGRWSITLAVSLASDDYLVVDPRPWTRHVTTRFGTNSAGAFTATSPPLSDLTLPPGDTTLVLRGTDATGTASASVAWRDAYTTY